MQFLSRKSFDVVKTVNRLDDLKGPLQLKWFYGSKISLVIITTGIKIV